MERSTLYHRIVIKAGTNLLTSGTGHLEQDVMAGLVEQIVRLHRQDVEVLLVTSGAVAAGREALRHGEEQHRKGSESAPADLDVLDRSSTTVQKKGAGAQPQSGAASREKKRRGAPRALPWSWELPFRQVLAAVGQSRLMSMYEGLFASKGIQVAQALVTRRDVADRLGYLNIRNTLLSLLSLRVVPILNENDVVAVEELAGEVFGDNDTLSALVANVVDADLLVMLGDIAGLYTADPHTHPEAHLIPRVERLDEVDAQVGASWNGVGRGGMVTKLEAARLATASGVTTVIADGRETNVLERLATGEAVGTYFPPAASRMESRRRWMLSAISSRGSLVADSGAVNAMRGQNRSLLPPGVEEVRGRFQRGEVVAIFDAQEQRVAVGIVNYESKDVRSIMGMRSDRIGATLGYEYEAEVVHRNNMVVL